VQQDHGGASDLIDRNGRADSSSWARSKSILFTCLDARMKLAGQLVLGADSCSLCLDYLAKSACSTNARIYIFLMMRFVYIYIFLQSIKSWTGGHACMVTRTCVHTSPSLRHQSIYMIYGFSF
jgi:hypothetical protein